MQILDQFYAIANKVMSVDEIQLGLIEQRTQTGSRKKPNVAKTNDSEPVDADLTETDIESPILKTRCSGLRGRTPHQSQYIGSILELDVTLSIGPVGTGRTYLAVACVVNALKLDAVKRLVLIRLVVQSRRTAGFFAGRPGAKGRSLSAPFV